MPNKAAQLYRLLRPTGRERRLGTVIFFITSRCNARCETCFYHEELNRPGDMTFEEIARVSRTMPAITDLWLSGGEPTLRHDASEVIQLFVENNGVRRVIIPTNGLLKGRTFEIVDRALALHSELHLYLNVALDGYGETHDRVRGVPGNWGRTLDCIRSLYPLKDRYAGRFRLNVNTVVCSENYAEVERLADFMFENFRLDGHYFNIVRGETKAGEGIKQVPPEVLPALYARVSALTAAYGERIAVVDYDGGVRACELRGRFGSLRDYGFDFGALWADRARAEELAAIDGGSSCWCTHVCFIHDSMRHSRRAQLWEVPKNYLT